MDTEKLHSYFKLVGAVTRSGSIWTQKAKLLANDRAIGDRLGTFVAMSGNGDLAILGAYQEDTSPYTNNGAAYVFTG